MTWQWIGLAVFSLTLLPAGVALLTGLGMLMMLTGCNTAIVTAQRTRETTR